MLSHLKSYFSVIVSKKKEGHSSIYSLGSWHKTNYFFLVQLPEQEIQGRWILQQAKHWTLNARSDGLQALLFFLCCFGLRLARPFGIRTRSYLSNFSILQSILCKIQLPGNTSTSDNRDKSKGSIKTHIPDELTTI